MDARVSLPSAEVLEQQLLSRLRKVVTIGSGIVWHDKPAHARTSDRGCAEWTNVLLNTLLALAPSYGFVPWPEKLYLAIGKNGALHNRKYKEPTSRGEYMVDAAWTTYLANRETWLGSLRSGHAPHRIELACESEWVSGYQSADDFLLNLLDDFAKLTDLKAPLKLFIFSYLNGPDANFEAVCQLCNRQATPIAPGEQYLLLGWPWDACWAQVADVRSKILSPT